MKTFISLLALSLFLLFAAPVKAQTSTITWNTTFQTIDGFGAASVFESLSSAQATQFFSTTSGLGFSLLREQVPGSPAGVCSTVNSTCAGDVATANLVIALGAKVWAAPWSPPAAMKSNGTTICNNGSGDGSLLAGSYGAYATWLSNYIKSLASQGISLYALSVQNEPTFCPTTYDGAIWSDTNMDSFIKGNLGPTMAAQGQTGVRIIMPESSDYSNLNSVADTCMADSSCYNFLGINAWHDYDATYNPPNAATNPYSALGKGYWETEASAGPGFGPSLCGGCWDPSIADGMLWASIIDDRMAIRNANSWQFWWIIGLANDNEGLTNPSVGATDSKRMYVLGQYSRFVRPGWIRLGATHAPVSGVTVSAYKDPTGSGKFAIVATNQNGTASNVTFSLSGFGTVTTVTPWITSASQSLTSLANISVSSLSFTNSLPASSVTTFVGTATAGGGTPVFSATSSCSNSPNCNFGTFGVGVSSSEQDITIANPGGTANLSVNLPYSITGTNAGDFVITNNNLASTCGGTVTPNTSCFIGITFTPASTGTRTASLILTHNAAGSPTTFALSGLGGGGCSVPSGGPTPISPITLCGVATSCNNTSIVCTYTDPGVAPGQHFYFVVAQNSNGYSTVSNSINVTVASGSHNAVITWNPSVTSSPAVTYYIWRGAPPTNVHPTNIQ